MKSGGFYNEICWISHEIHQISNEICQISWNPPQLTWNPPDFMKSPWFHMKSTWFHEICWISHEICLISYEIHLISCMKYARFHAWNMPDFMHEIHQISWCQMSQGPMAQFLVLLSSIAWPSWIVWTITHQILLGWNETIHVGEWSWSPSPCIPI